MTRDIGMIINQCCIVLVFAINRLPDVVSGQVDFWSRAARHWDVRGELEGLNGLMVAWPAT